VVLGLLVGTTSKMGVTAGLLVGKVKGMLAGMALVGIAVGGMVVRISVEMGMEMATLAGPISPEVAAEVNGAGMFWGVSDRAAVVGVVLVLLFSSPTAELTTSVAGGIDEASIASLLGTDGSIDPLGNVVADSSALPPVVVTPSIWELVWVGVWSGGGVEVVVAGLSNVAGVDVWSEGGVEVVVAGVSDVAVVGVRSEGGVEVVVGGVSDVAVVGVWSAGDVEVVVAGVSDAAFVGVWFVVAVEKSADAGVAEFGPSNTSAGPPLVPEASPPGKPERFWTEGGFGMGDGLPSCPSLELAIAVEVVADGSGRSTRTGGTLVGESSLGGAPVGVLVADGRLALPGISTALEDSCGGWLDNVVVISEGGIVSAPEFVPLRAEDRISDVRVGGWGSSTAKDDGL
jgi:hypothetical protein